MKALTGTEDSICWLLKRNGPMTPTEIHRQTGFARETVWRNVRNLIESGCIRKVKEAEYVGGMKGMAGALYEAVPAGASGHALHDVMHAWMREAA